MFIWAGKEGNYANCRQSHTAEHPPYLHLESVVMVIMATCWIRPGPKVTGKHRGNVICVTCAIDFAHSQQWKDPPNSPVLCEGPKGPSAYRASPPWWHWLQAYCGSFQYQRNLWKHNGTSGRRTMDNSTAPTLLSPRYLFVHARQLWRNCKRWRKHANLPIADRKRVARWSL